MGYLKDFEEDVFISYATIDNDRYPGEPVGWVAQFHEDLTKRLKGRLGSDVVRLWRDIEIRNNEDFTNKIMARLSKTATLIGVLSPSFLNRTWTLRELETFSQYAGRGIGLLIKGEKSRIFKVEKLEIDRNSLPALMQGTKSYRFIKEETQREFRPYLESDRSGYLKQLDDLAIDIANLLCEMALPAPPADRIAVYVAETTRELADQLRDIRRELTAKGYTVLPEGDLSHQADEYEMEVRKNLELAAISVHLIGAKYGLIPEGETRSIVRIQHDLAMERNADPDFARLVWMPADLHPTEDNQRKFIEFLRTDHKAQEGAEILETKFDDLKTALHDKIAAIKRLRERPKPPSPAGGEAGRPAAPAAIGATRTGSEYPTAEEPPTIYIMCDRLDLPSRQLAALKHCLLDQGYEPIVPTEANLGDGFLARHLENLKSCDSFIIFYGSGSPEWFDNKLNDYRQYLRGRAKRVLAKAVYVASSDAENKRDLRTNEALVLRAGGEFFANDIEPFLQRLRAAYQRPS